MIVYMLKKIVTESNTQRMGGYASYRESSYPGAGGVSAMIPTERSRVRLMSSVAICIRDAGGNVLTIFNADHPSWRKIIDTFGIRDMYSNSRMNGIMQIPAIRRAFFPDLLENSSLRYLMEQRGLLIFSRYPRPFPVSENLSLPINFCTAFR